MQPHWEREERGRTSKWKKKWSEINLFYDLFFFFMHNDLARFSSVYFLWKSNSHTRPTLIEIQQMYGTEEAKLFDGREMHRWERNRRRRGWRQAKVEMAKSSKSTVPFFRSFVRSLNRSFVQLAKNTNEWPMRWWMLYVHCTRYADEVTASFVHKIYAK